MAWNWLIRRLGATGALAGAEDSKARKRRKPPASEQHKEAALHLKHGRERYNAKNYSAALEEFRRAVELDTEYALAHYYVGLAAYKLNDSQSAERAWTRAEELGPTSDTGLKARSKLELVKRQATNVVKELEQRVRGGR